LQQVLRLEISDLCTGSYQTLANDINGDRTSADYVGITADAICRQSLPSERTFRAFEVNIKQTESLKFRFGTRRPTVSRSVGHYLELLKTFFKNGT
jgi:hypothetical protein